MARCGNIILELGIDKFMNRILTVLFLACVAAHCATIPNPATTNSQPNVMSDYLHNHATTTNLLVVELTNTVPGDAGNKVMARYPVVAVNSTNSDGVNPVAYFYYGHTKDLIVENFAGAAQHDDVCGWSLYGLDDNVAAPASPYLIFFMSGYGGLYLPQAGVYFDNDYSSHLDNNNIHSDGSGNLTAVSYSGDGAGITNITAANVSGVTILTNSSLTAYVINGAGITNATTSYSTNVVNGATNKNNLTRTVQWTIPVAVSAPAATLGSAEIDAQIQRSDGVWITVADCDIAGGATSIIATNKESLVVTVPSGASMRVTNSTSGTGYIAGLDATKTNTFTVFP
jgi:hypothetical protein